MRLQNWQIKKLKYDDNAYFTHHQTSLLQNLSKFNFLLFIKSLIKNEKRKKIFCISKLILEFKLTKKS